MNRIIAAARFVLAEFGPLIGFWLLVSTLGIKPAIAGSVAIIVVDALWRCWRGLSFTRLYLLTSSLTVAFGLIDLTLVNPFMVKFESVVTNVATGIMFAVGAYGPKSLIQQVAERREGKPFPERADVRRFFQLFTLAWAGYFFVKAAFYLWVAWTLPIMQAMALRSIVGGVSLGLMIAISVTQGRRLFALCQRWGLLPPAGAAE